MKNKILIFYYLSLQNVHLLCQDWQRFGQHCPHHGLIALRGGQRAMVTVEGVRGLWQMDPDGVVEDHGGCICDKLKQTFFLIFNSFYILYQHSSNFPKSIRAL